MRRTSPLIVGGGPAGAAAAITLARAGHDHLLVERSRETGDALCGGFLSWRTLDTLAGLGIDTEALNPADVTRVRLFAGTSVAEAGLPRRAKAVSRRRLDRLLLDQAVASGAKVERGVAARAFENGRVRLDGEEVDAVTVLLATGKHDLRGLARPAAARGHDPTLGLRVRLAPSATLSRIVGDAIELHMFDRGYAGLVLQEDGSGNLCMAMHRSRLDEAGSPAALIGRLGQELPALGERLIDFDRGATVDAIANVPYGWRAKDTLPGIFRLGDQAGVIPSLAGEGMGIALATGTSAAAAVMAGRDAPAWQRHCAIDLRRPIAIASVVRATAERPVTASLMVRLASLVPSAVAVAARLTRINNLGR